MAAAGRRRRWLFQAPAQAALKKRLLAKPHRCRRRYCEAGPEKIPQLPVKPRKIEGRVASVTPNGVYIALGSYNGVLTGDRYEVRQINNRVFDPEIKEPIATEAVKVGELVVTEVDEKSAIGNYGGHPLSPDYITSKGYQVRLMSK